MLLKSTVKDKSCFVPLSSSEIESADYESHDYHLNYFKIHHDNNNSCSWGESSFESESSGIGESIASTRLYAGDSSESDWNIKIFENT